MPVPHRAVLDVACNRAGHGIQKHRGTEITNDSLGVPGRELPNAPRHKANVWIRYRFAGNAVRGLMIAGGVVYEGDRFTSRDNVITAPAYTRFDASSSWPLPGRRLTLGLVAENLTDLRYVRSGAGGVLFAGPPATSRSADVGFVLIACALGNTLSQDLNLQRARSSVSAAQGTSS